MGWQILKIGLAAAVIAGCSWLSGKSPRLAGFLLALPLSTLLALPFAQVEFQDSEKSVAFARSVFLALPMSLLFFVPFLFAARLNFGFWGLYTAGLTLLIVGYGIYFLVAG